MKDFLGYENKTVMVTGAASGMGYETAKALVELGADVYALDVSTVNIAGVKDFIPTDLSSRESIDAAFTKIPERIDSYFGIAGVSGARNDFLTTVKIDAISNKYIIEEYLAKRMNEGGAIALMTSLGGLGWEKESNKKWLLPVLEAKGWDEAVKKIEESPFVHLPGIMGYPYSKLAMNLYVALAQKEFASQGIRVNAVLPASTKSGLTDEFEKMAGGNDKLMANNGYATRLAASSEMAMPIIFLNSDMASYVSGVLLDVDYGGHVEEIAGLKKQVNDIDLDQILAYIQSQQS